MFKKFKKLYDAGKMNEIANSKQGLLWLKLKTVSRKEFLDSFLKNQNIKLKNSTTERQFEELFFTYSKDNKITKILEQYIKDENARLYGEINAKQLITELYKLEHFDWGGDYKNSLDKYLVSHYVKTFYTYKELLTKLDSEISIAVKGYVLNSWYNHWTSILIEHIFKSNKNVLPAIGQVKNIDFFIKDIPFDLKTTYLPAGYIAERRKIKNLLPENTFLKQAAKKANIDFDKNGNASYQITERLKDKNNKFGKEILEVLQKDRMTILQESQENPKLLIKWLYENQGEMRFSSENRIYLVLVDKIDFSNSWKLKRNMDLLTPKINNYLNNFKPLSKIKFNYKNSKYEALADVIFVIRG